MVWVVVSSCYCELKLVLLLAIKLRLTTFAFHFVVVVVVVVFFFLICLVKVPFIFYITVLISDFGKKHLKGIKTFLHIYYTKQEANEVTCC